MVPRNQRVCWSRACPWNGACQSHLCRRVQPCQKHSVIKVSMCDVITDTNILNGRWRLSWCHVYIGSKMLAAVTDCTICSWTPRSLYAGAIVTESIFAMHHNLLPMAWAQSGYPLIMSATQPFNFFYPTHTPLQFTSYIIIQFKLHLII